MTSVNELNAYNRGRLEERDRCIEIFKRVHWKYGDLGNTPSNDEIIGYYETEIAEAINQIEFGRDVD